MVKYKRSHLYLTAIIDWFSRKIMGWTLSDTLEYYVPDDYFYGRHLPQKTVSYQHA